MFFRQSRIDINRYSGVSIYFNNHSIDSLCATISVNVSVPSESSKVWYIPFEIRITLKKLFAPEQQETYNPRDLIPMC